VHRALLVAHLVVAEVGVAQQRLAHAGDAAVAEDAETAGEERVLHAVVLDVLVLEKLDEGLRHGQAHRCGCCHVFKLLVVRSGLGSNCWIFLPSG
jgi:hypothetical protein